jgi:hypothetical protein
MGWDNLPVVWSRHLFHPAFQISDEVPEMWLPRTLPPPEFLSGDAQQIVSFTIGAVPFGRWGRAEK